MLRNIPYTLAAALSLALYACGDDATEPANTAGTTASGSTAGQGQNPQAGTNPTMGTTTAATAGTGGAMPAAGAAGTGTAGTAAGTAAGSSPMAAQAGTGSGGASPMGAQAGTGAGTPDAGAMDATPGSDADTGGGSLGGPLMFTGGLTAGDTVPARHKCPAPFNGGTPGENVSPPLAWSGGPTETQSFALVLYDTQYSMLHWVLWDIPPDVTMLPEGLPSGYELSNPAGAHQRAAMGSDDHAYAGPCSSAGVGAGTYEFRLYALDTAMLALTQSSSASEAQAAVEAAMLEMTVWTATPE